jgi:hypothetical protein
LIGPTIEYNDNTLHDPTQPHHEHRSGDFVTEQNILTPTQATDSTIVTIRPDPLININLPALLPQHSHTSTTLASTGVSPANPPIHQNQNTWPTFRVSRDTLVDQKNLMGAWTNAPL